MITLTSAQDALKDAYLGAVTEALNINANPLLAKIKQTTNDVWGKEIIRLTSYGVNGGVGAGTETGALPTSGENKYVKFVTTLKNLYGTIEISDKAIRASENNAGAFVNLLNSEMESLIKSANYNFGRMLFSDGTGKLASIQSATGSTVVVDTIKPVIEGLRCDFYKASDNSAVADMQGVRITAIDRANKKITFEKAMPTAVTGGSADDFYITVQNSKGQELTGLGAIFKSTGTLYGVDRANYSWMVPSMKTASSGKLTETAMQELIDDLSEVSGSEVDYITCASNVKRIYQALLTTNKRNIDVMELQGGFKAISYNGIPVISDRFIEDGVMYLLNTKDFALHQLCDWRWLEGEDGKILKQKAGYPAYTATLVKYADLICTRPNGQAKLSGITQ